MLIRIEGIEVSITAGKYQKNEWKELFRNEDSTWLLPMFKQTVSLKRGVRSRNSIITDEEKRGLFASVSTAIDKINMEFERGRK